MEGEVWQSKREAVGHTESAVRKEREVNAGAQLAFPDYSMRHLSPQDSTTHPSLLSQTFPETPSKT